MKMHRVVGLLGVLMFVGQNSYAAGTSSSKDRLGSLTNFADADLPYSPSNLSFEWGADSNGLPLNWLQVNQGYTFVVDGSDKVDGRYSARLSAQSVHDAFGALGQCIDASHYLDSEIEFSGYIKTSNVANAGFAGLWFRVDGPGGEELAFDNMYGRGVTGTRSWRRYKINLPVVSSAVRLCYGVLLIDEGTAWFDKITLEIR